MSVLMLLLALGCGGDTPAPTAKAAPVDVAAVLAKADAKDGTVDHTVAQCSGCSLAMEGNPLHALKTDGYELHFCSEGCKSNFAEHKDEGMAGLAKAVTH